MKKYYLNNIYQQDDNLPPNLILPAEETDYIGVWGELLKAPPQSFVLQFPHFRQTPFPPFQHRRTSPPTFFSAG